VDTTISSSAVLGASIGSIFGSYVNRKGRRRAVLIMNLACAICVVPTLYCNIYSICVGRLLFGLCGGIYQVTIPRMIEETVPAYKLGTFGIVTNLANNAGKMLSLVIGVAVPDKNSPEALTSNFWRFMFGLPWALIAL
jgi:MFS family permease